MESLRVALWRREALDCRVLVPPEARRSVNLECRTELAGTEGCLGVMDWGMPFVRREMNGLAGCTLGCCHSRVIGSCILLRGWQIALALLLQGFVSSDTQSGHGFVLHRFMSRWMCGLVKCMRTLRFAIVCLRTGLVFGLNVALHSGVCVYRVRESCFALLSDWVCVCWSPCMIHVVFDHALFLLGAKHANMLRLALSMIQLWARYRSFPFMSYPPTHNTPNSTCVFPSF